MGQAAFLEYLDAVVQEFRLEISFYKLDDFRQNAACVHLIVGSAADPQGRALPKIVVVDLGDGYVELPADSVLDAVENLPLAFQRRVPPKKKIYFEDAYKHFLKGSGHFFNAIALGHVARFYVVKILKPEAAFGSRGGVAGEILVALER